jgi:excisionase family DNA binding protein
MSKTIQEIYSDQVYRMVETKNPKIEPLLLRGGEVAELIGCSRAMAYRLMQRGVLPTLRVPGGKSVRVPREALIEWIRANTRGSVLGTRGAFQ